MRRLFWVAVGAAAGVYAVRKVQTIVHAYSAAGLTDRASGAGESVRALVQEIAGRMAERESDLRQALGINGDGDDNNPSAGHTAGATGPTRRRPALSPAAAADLIDHPASDRPGLSGDLRARPGTTLPRSST